MSLISNLDAVPEEIRVAVRNNGGGHVNHSMFWKNMRRAGGGQPTGKLAEDMISAFGSFGDFKSAFTEAAMTRFGSGWAWLCVDTDGGLMVTSTPNQDNPAMEGRIPLLGLDVWEHAYYLTYQNRRADYVEAWWNVVDWSYVAGSYTAVHVDAQLDKAADWAQQQWSKLEDAWNKLVD
jgi:Fe-Mn family superoxide dismutase